MRPTKKNSLVITAIVFLITVMTRVPGVWGWKTPTESMDISIHSNWEQIKHKSTIML